MFSIPPSPPSVHPSLMTKKASADRSAVRDGCRPAVRFGFSDVMDGASELILDLLVAPHQKFHLIVCPGRRRGIAPEGYRQEQRNADNDRFHFVGASNRWAHSQQRKVSIFLSPFADLSGDFLRCEVCPSNAQVASSCPVHARADNPRSFGAAVLACASIFIRCVLSSDAEMAVKNKYGVWRNSGFSRALRRRRS